MADYSKHRSDGVGGKGILIAIVVIGLFAVLLGVLGTGTVPVVEGDAAAPAAIETTPVAPAEEAPAVVE